MSSLDSPDGLPPVSHTSLPDISSRSRAQQKRSAAAPAAEPLPERIGSYRIVDILGEGGMGRVYRAVQDNPSREVALKVMRPGTTTPERLLRFEHEAKVLARLQHPGIAQIFEASIADSGQGPQPYFAMELIQGVKVTRFVTENSLEVPAVLRQFTQVCQAVQHAHQRGIIHRDLKPDNILVDRAGQPKIIDFGVARLIDPEMQRTNQGTSVGQLVGTLRYMSPEQVQADPDEVDTRSDVYTLGVICYELLAGRMPYELKALPLPKIVQVISQAEPTPLSSINKVFRGDIDTIVLKAIEKDKSRRYQSAAELAADIDRYLTDQPIQARPASALYQLRKFARRNRALVGGIVTTFVALLLGIIGTTWWAMVARQARIEAEQSEFATIEKTAQLAMQRGSWHDALRYIDQALATDIGSGSIRLRLDRVRALFAVNDTQAALRELETLAKRNDLAGKEGAVLLTEADILQGKDIPATITRIKQAQDKGLSPAEDAYAQALCASSTPEAVRALRKSLELNPYQPRAHNMLSLLLLLLGQKEQARLELRTYAALFPEDLNLKLMQALLLASEGDGPGADAQLASLAGQLDETTLADLRTIVGAVAEACDARKWANWSGIPDLQHYVQRFAAIDARRWRFGRGRAGAGHPDANLVLPLPPLLRQSFGRLQNALSMAGKQRDEVVIAELESVHAIHPEGTIRYILALIHFAPGRLIEAEKEGLAAVEEPALFPIHRQALWVAATAEGYLGTPRRPNPDLQRRYKAAQTLKQALAILPAQPHEREIAAKIALYAGETNLSSHLLDDWERKDPKAMMVHWLRAMVKLREGAYLPAIEEARKVLAANPGDVEMQQLLKEATEKLKKDASKIRPP
jgi:tetratricopeptide (TPR) repeat protein